MCLHIFKINDLVQISHYELNSIQGFPCHINKGNKTLNMLSHNDFEIISSSIKKEIKTRV